MVDPLSIVSLVLTVAGFSLAIWQIVKTRRAAQAATAAASAARDEIKKNVMLTDVVLCDKLLDEIRLHLRHQKIELALLRTTDLSAQLIQLRNIYAPSPPEINFQGILTQLSILRTTLEAKVYSPDQPINTAQINNKLAHISATLNDCIGKQRFSSKGE